MAFRRDCRRISGWRACGGFVSVSWPMLLVSCAAQNRVAAPVEPSARELVRIQAPAPEPETSDSSPLSPPPAIALVVGNARYAAGPLKNPGNDADDMAAALRELHFDVDEVVNADKLTFQRAIIAFGKKLRASGGIGLFYFSGHGLQVNGKNYLVPVDAKLEDEAYVDVETVSTDYVLDAMDAAGNGANIMVLDACRNNPFARSFRSVARGLAFMSAPAGTLIAYATNPGNVSGDGAGRNGVYTGALLAFLRDAGLGIEQVLKKTTARVVEDTQDNPVKQVPWYASSLRRDIILTGFDPTVSLGIAKADLAKGECAEAAEVLASALNEGGGAWDAHPQDLDEAHQLLAQASAACGEFETRLDPPDTMLRVDGASAVVNHETLLLNPGSHTVEGSRQGYQTVTKSVDSAAGQHGVLDLGLPKGPDLVDPIPRPPDWLSWGLMAGGGALAAGALATGIISSTYHATLAEKCANGCDSSTYPNWQSDQSTGKTLQLTSDILLGAGLASAAAGVSLFFFHRSHAEGPPPIVPNVACASGGCVGHVRLAF